MNDRQKQKIAEAKAMISDVQQVAVDMLLDAGVKVAVPVGIIPGTYHEQFEVYPDYKGHRHVYICCFLGKFYIYAYNKISGDANQLISTNDSSADATIPRAVLEKIMEYTILQ